MVLPLLKLGTLGLRALSKPVANRLKQQAAHYPRFREFIISLAQVNHRFTTTLQRHIYGHATDVEIRPLNEGRAVQVASDLLGEMFIFLVAGAAVIFEVQRSAKSEAKKEEKTEARTGDEHSAFDKQKKLLYIDPRRSKPFEKSFICYRAEVRTTAKRWLYGMAQIPNALRARDEALSKEVELLKLKIMELEKLAQGRDITGLFNFKFAQSEAEKSAKAA